MVNHLVEAKVKLMAFLTAITWGSIGVDKNVRIDASEWVMFSIGNVDFRIATVVSILAGVGTVVTLVWTLISIKKALKTNREKSDEKPKDRKKM